MLRGTRSSLSQSFVLPGNLPKIVRNFKKAEFYRGRIMRRKDMTFEYPKRRLCKKEDYAKDQALYLTDVMINIPEESKKMFDINKFQQGNSADPAKDGQLDTSHAKTNRASAILKNLCPNHTSSIYDYKRAVEVQAKRIDEFQAKIRAPWRRMFT